MNRQIRPLVLIAILVLLIVNGCTRPEAPVFEKVRDIVVAEKSGDSIAVTAMADFFNPNNYRMTLKKAEIDVLLDGKKISSLQQEFDLVIDKNSSFTIPLEASISKSEIQGNFINSALSMLFGKKLSLNYVGYIRVKAYGIRIRVPVEGESSIDLRDL